MKKEDQVETGGSLGQTDLQKARATPVAIKVGDAYYGLLSHHFMCTVSKKGRPVLADEIPNVARKHCGGCGRSLLPYPASGLIAIDDKIIRGLQTNRSFFGQVLEISQHEGFQEIPFEAVQVRWEQSKGVEWVRADELLLFDEWEKENPTPSMRNFWSASAPEQASIRSGAGMYWE
jgi:hypothetical protein